jgi:hypothetical protein
MALKDLGTKRDKTVFEGPASAKDFPTVTYPKVDLPLSFIEGKDVKRDDEVEIKIKARVCGYEDNEWRKIVTFELKEGEIVGKDSKQKEKNTLLG